MQISREVFDTERRPRFGAANPEQMRLAFWEWMIRGDDTPPPDDDCSLGEFGFMVRRGILKSSYGPYRARDVFGVKLNPDDGPIWTFDRMGRTRTELPDGRVICIGGEHEDWYDPDFCIYNDVVVFGPTDNFEIYGYPKEIFPPTDFHTASLVGERIFIIGCLGYSEDRRPNDTPVYSLDLSNYRISQMATTGQAPGWIFKHEADVTPEGLITIRGGEVQRPGDGQRPRRNVEDFAVDTRSGVWRQLTSRNWLQFSISPEDESLFAMKNRPEVEQLYPHSIEHSVEPCEKWNGITFIVSGVPISVTVETSDIEIVVEGDLSNELAHCIAEEVRASTEAVVQQRCVVTKV